MPREREKNSRKIKFADYDINGNQIRAYYNGSRELIFVLDETINADKPNVLLVIDSFDDRKWDDILENDYGIDLETIRPKRDNKYQKLDIEYSGLDVYSDLIDAYDADEDLDEPLENLERFRIMSVRRSARERLAVAEETISKTQETIERTNGTIADLRAKIKDLRAKLAEQKRGIGREPTKASASKILKTEAQIDATNEKMARAKKRLASAQRRLVNAEDDAEIARAILARHNDVKSVRRTATRSARTVSPRRVAVAPVADNDGYDDDDDYNDDVDDEDMSEYSNNSKNEYNESAPDENYDSYDEDVNNDAVKPLFDRDPEILDENIAFKPIDFGVSENPTPSFVTPNEPDVAPAPLSFTPQVDTHGPENDGVLDAPAPMLDSLTTVTEPTIAETGIEIQEQQPEPVIEPMPAVEPAPVAQSEPIVSIEPIAAARPVSPITGYNAQVDTKTTRRPTLVYYIMLILLIALSIFTLWLYQSKNGAVLPDLATTTVASGDNDKPVVTESNIPTPFVRVENEIPETKQAEPVVIPEPVKEIVPEPAPVVAKPEPVAVDVEKVEPVFVSEPVAVIDVAVTEDVPDDVVVESPFVELRTVANYEPEKKPIPTEEEILARKPGYSVSQNEKMFVAAPEYETETVVSANYSMDTDVQPMPATIDDVPEIVASDVVELDQETCADGAPADRYGCCAGETYMYTADGYMCCVEGDCFPPLQ